MSRSMKVAVFLLKRGYPLPLDLVFRLHDEGIDVDRLEARFNS